ncbi:hypothetical protein M231_00089 [Tremella mesenterica]|uniref:Ergosterol biosynthetic protein 28 n=1 Tax=Tremella mesenterica TaxID=5217 RepID=A0A4Q1BWI4_TREME|nr:hypothetical protein M231_00089 [Tremella mesenterica]
MSYINLPPTPSQGGLLPYWLLFTAAASVYNTGQAYFASWQSREVYSGKPTEMTPLASRLFGTWTLLAAAIRFRAAYDISSPAMYDLVMAKFAIASIHFWSEMLIFGSVKLNRASIGPLVIGTGSLVWCLTQRNYYLGL